MGVHTHGAAFVLLVGAGCMTEVPGPQVEERAIPSYEEFLADTYQEPDSGIFIVDGDVPMQSEKQLLEFYEQVVLAEIDTRAAALDPEGGDPGEKTQGLIVHRAGGADVVWSAAQKRDLRYCVSTAFGSRHATVVAAMQEATAAWEQVADVDFLHVSSEDAACSSTNGNVIFDVNPVNAGGQYLARAFFPNNPRSSRNVLVDGSAFTTSQPSLVGILRHELGHTIGFRHEHTRPESGACFEDSSWRALTPYDSASVMHYPQCNGSGDSTLTLTSLDGQGAASVYGAPSGGGDPGQDPGQGTDPGGGAAGETLTDTFSATVARNQNQQYGPFAVLAGTTFRATLSGSGDPDLYVQFGQAPTTRSFACRPYLDGANEACELTVPAGVGEAFVMVRGYTQASFTLTVAHTVSAPAGGGDTPTQGAPTTESFSGALDRGATRDFGPFAVVAGSSFVAALSGTGDPDLYVRFGAAPTTSAFDCRPYLGTAAETCNLTVPAGVEAAYVMVRGYAAATFSLSVTHTTP